MSASSHYDRHLIVRFNSWVPGWLCSISTWLQLEEKSERKMHPLEYCILLKFLLIPQKKGIHIKYHFQKPWKNHILFILPLYPAINVQCNIEFIAEFRVNQFLKHCSHKFARSSVLKNQILRIFLYLRHVYPKHR